MGPLAAYSIKSAILLSILLAIYMLTLGRVKDATLRRTALLIICVVSSLLPLIHHHTLLKDSPERMEEPSITTSTLISNEDSISIIYNIIAIIIVTGICVGAILSIYGFVRILMMKTTTAYRHGHKLKLMTERHTAPFCFCGIIYISENDFNDLPEMILTHETSHISHLHFIDLFLGRMILILQWWNPLAWLSVREMQLVHEYQADGDVLDAGYDPKEYQYILLNRATGDAKYNFVSGLRNRKLKDRLIMINRDKSGRRKTIFLLMIIIPTSFIAIALPSSSITPFINDKFSAISFESFQKTSVENTGKKSDKKPHITIDGTAIPYESIGRLNRAAIQSITIRKDQPEYPYGVIEITTKPEANIYNDGNFPDPE